MPCYTWFADESGSLFWSNLAVAKDSPYQALQLRASDISLENGSTTAALAIDSNGNFIAAYRPAVGDPWGEWQKLPCPERALATADDVKMLLDVSYKAGMFFARESMQTAWMRDNVYKVCMCALNAHARGVLP